MWGSQSTVSLSESSGCCFSGPRHNRPASMVIAATASGLLAALAAAGHVFPDLTAAWWAPVGAALLSGPLLFLIESRVHPAKWTLWQEYMARTNAWEIFTGRHIPDLRDSGD